MQIQLSDHFTFPRLLRFVAPSIATMIFTSIYGVVDGFFVSNFVGKTPFAAINLIMPVLMILGSLGLMLSTGGSAIVSRTFGEGDRVRANRYFSMLVYVTIVLGLLLTVLGMIFLRPVARFLGAEGAVLEYCVEYGRILLVALTAYMLQFLFQSFLVTAERPHLGLVVTVAAGVTNMVLDFLFVAVFQWGLPGAAWATVISQLIGGLVPLIYFICPNKSLLRLGRARLEWRVLLKTCTNGSSELLSNISTSVVSMLYNFQLMRIAGEDGIAAYGVIMYVNLFFNSFFFGYAIGSAPLIGYHYGAENHGELKNLFRKSLFFMALSGVIMLVLAEVLAWPLSAVFVSYDAQLLALTIRGFRLYSIAFLFAGFSVFGSAFFTALSNGAVSAAISFLRTLVFQLAAVLLLPLVLGVDGIWLAIVVAEILSLLVTVLFFVRMRGRYHYV